METTDDPVRQALDINLNLGIDLWAPRRKASLVLGETVDGLLAEISDEVYSFLEGHSVVVHHDRNHVVCVAFGLFAVVREEVLEKVDGENWETVGNPVWILTFDQETKSFAASSKLWMIGCSITSSGKSNPYTYSMKAQDGLQPDVSLRTAM